MREHDNHPHVQFTPDIGSQASGSKPTTLQMFSKLGWRIFPVNSTKEDGECTCGRLNCPNKGKHPRVTGWPEQATTNLIQHSKWMKQWPDTNWALACGQESGVWVLDVDEKNGGYESLAKLESEIGELPATVRVKTGGGGLHIYFAWPTDGTIITNAVNLKGNYPGLDVRGYRGYVVIPPAKHKSGNRYEWMEGCRPDEVSLAEAPPALIDLVSSAAPLSSLKSFNDNGEPWDDMEVEDAGRNAKKVCHWIADGTSKEGADALSEPEWAVLIATGRSLRKQDDGLAQLWSKNYSTYDEGVVREKWNDHGYKGIPSCKYIQSQFAPKACQTCPFRDAGKSPGYHIRKARARELGLKGLWGAPKTTDDKSINSINKTREKAQNGAGEGSMEAQHAANEINEAYTQVAAAAADAVIDVTEDDEEGSTTPSAGAQEQSTYQQPNFRIASDNITPLIDRSKALEEKLRSGVNGHDLLHDVAKVLAAIKRLDELRYEIELDRLVSAENAGKSRKEQKYKKTSVEAAVKSAAEREAAEILTQMTTVGEVWPDAPEEHHELPLPTGYKYSDDGVEKFVATAQGNIGAEEVSSQPSYMAGWREDITTGEIQAVIRTRTRNRGWIEITSEPSGFGDKRKTADLRNVGCDFAEEAIFGKYLSASYTLIRSRFGLEPELGTSRLGWHEVNDQLFFVFPEQSFGAMPVKLMDDNPDVRTDFSVCGDLQTEGEALVSMIFKYEKLAFAVGIAAASVLMRPAKLAGLVDMFGSCTEYVSAGTNTGKSTTVQAAFSIYGDPHSVRTFQTTQFGATKQFILRSDLPSVWQEAQAGEQKARDNNADPAILLHILGDGGGKLMGTKSGGLRGNPRIYGTMLLANNEKFVTPATAKQGELQRIFSFDPPFPDPHSDKTDEETRKGVKRDVEKLKQELSKHHGNGGREMVRMLIEVVGGSWTALKAKVEADFTQQYEAACKVIPESIENRSMLERRANMVALARVGLQYLIELGYSMPVQVAETLFRGVDASFLELIEHEIEQADTLIDSKKHKNTFIDYVQSNQTKFFPFEIKRSDGFMEDGEPVYKEPEGGYLGGVRKKNGELWIGVKSQKLMELFAKYQRSHTTLISAWAKESKPFVLADEKGKPIQKQGRIGRRGIQVRPNMYFFRFDDFGLELVEEHIKAINSLPDDF